MFQPKEEIYRTLKSLGYACMQSSQATFNEVPAITFWIGENTPEYSLDNEIAKQDVEVVIDIFTNKSTDLSRILSEVEAKMRTINYRLVHSVDVPNPEGTLFHSNCRFSAVKFK
jgi:hypothetical protein